MYINQKGFSVLDILIVCFIFVIIGFLGWYVFQYRTSQKDSTSISKSGTEQKLPQKYSSTANWEEVELSASDNQRKQDVQTILFKLVAYRATHGSYPSSAVEARAIQEKNPLIDPDTLKPYNITDVEPALGEMQYKPSSTCDNANRRFVPSNTKNINAFIVRLSEGSFICKSNTR